LPFARSISWSTWRIVSRVRSAALSVRCDVLAGSLSRALRVRALHHAKPPALHVCSDRWSHDPFNAIRRYLIIVTAATVNLGEARSEDRMRVDECIVPVMGEPFECMRKRRCQPRISFGRLDAAISSRASF
jgi:hypothetical protein